MNPIIAEHMDEIEAACKEFGVIRLELFGSAATDAFDPERSDFDFIVELSQEPSERPRLWLFLDFQDRMQKILGRPVDLVMSGAPKNPYFLRSMDASRRLLYAA